MNIDQAAFEAFRQEMRNEFSNIYRILKSYDRDPRPIETDSKPANKYLEKCQDIISGDNDFSRIFFRQMLARWVQR